MTEPHPMVALVRKLRCWLGYHRVLQVIQSFGAAQHIGCPDCKREIAIHHGMRTALPWDEHFAEMYRSFGYDVDAATTAWRAHHLQSPMKGE